MKNILVYGANSFIGHHFISELYNKYQIIAVVRRKNLKNYKFKNKVKKIISYEDFYKGNKDLLKSCDAILHLSCVNEKNQNKNIKTTKKVNNTDVIKLFKFSMKNKIKKFIFLSSFRVYGSNLNVNERSKTLENNMYTKLKIKTENELLNLQNNIDLKILRISNVIGKPLSNKNDIWHLAFFDFVLSALHKSRIKLKSDGSQIRNYIFIEDLINKLKLIIENNYKFRLSNICSNFSINIKNISLLIGEIIYSSLKFKIKIIISDKEIKLIKYKYSNLIPRTLNQKMYIHYKKNDIIKKMKNIIIGIYNDK